MTAAPQLLLLFVTLLCAGLYLAGVVIWAAILLAAPAASAFLLICNEIAVTQ